MRTVSRLLALGMIALPAAPAAAAPAQDAPLRGVVLTPDGSPAAGAVVWAAKLYTDLLDRRETVADAAGRYTLVLPPGKWYVWARRGPLGGEGPGLHEAVTVVAGRAPAPVTIRLEERGTLRGRLLAAEAGEPIPGGNLYLDMGLAVPTDAAGRFEVGGLTRGGHEAFVVAPGRQRMRVLFDTTARADTDLDVPVPAAGKIVGRVTDRAGNPIPGAYVGRHTSGTFFSISGLFTPCDPAGRFEYDDAVPADQPTRLTAAAPGYEPDEQTGTAAAAGGKPLELNFRLRPKPGRQPPGGEPADGREKLREVSGAVHGPKGEPVADVLVRWGYQPYTSAIHTRTGPDGRFRLTVPDKEDGLAVLPRAFTPQFPRVPAGGDRAVDVDLAEGHTVRGRVTDDAGTPLPGVRVIAVIPSPEPGIGNPFWLSESAGRTDPAGRFEVRGVPDHARFDFLKSGLSDARNQALRFDGDNAVTMLYGGAVGGRVVDRDGKPIRSFRVLVGFPRQRRPGDQTGGFFAGYSGIGVRFTAADGRFVVSGLGAGGVYRIRVLADGHGEAVADRVEAVPVNRLAAAEPVTIRAGAPVRFRVRAVAADGRPVAGARVTLVDGEPGLDQHFMWGYHDASWENMVRGRTAADGWADFPALGFGEATVVVRAPGYARHRRGWRTGQKELVIEMAPEAVLAGDVHDMAGKPVGECYLSLNSGGDQVSLSVGPDDGGRFRIPELPAGNWSVTVRGSNGRTELYAGQVTLKAGETRHLSIAAKRE